ncbi:FixH family protein [Metabacillus indicus]|uniref:FixH family protein n=1 Tax=Metabacillus indicus TaxID=246786 RepID=UPI003CFA0DD5
MKRVAAGILMVSAVFVLIACSKGENAAEGSLMVHAEISLPEKISLNTEETLSVSVTQGDQAVEDASEVQFEIWKADSKEESEMIRAEHTGDGIYEVQKSFSEEGSYFVQTHVTARDLHVMPKKEFVVGKGALTNKEEESNEEQTHH